MGTSRESGGWREAAPGVRALAWECGAWAMSPDGEWFAAADALPDTNNQVALRCVEVATGRVVFEKFGAPVKGLGWASNEALLAVREHNRGDARAVLHAVPDGGLLGSVAIAHVPGRVRVEPCGGAPLALVCSVRMTGGLRGDVPRRLVHVLRTDPLESALVFDPDASDALPRLPQVRDCAAGLSPDGRRLAVTASDKLLLRELGGDRDEVACDVGGWYGALTWVDPDTILAHPTDVEGLAAPANVDLISLSQRARRYTSEGEDAPLGWVGPRATVDLSPDRSLVLVAGTAVTPTVLAAKGAAQAVLRVIHTRDGSTSAPRALATNAEVAHGAAWLADGSIAVLRARKKTVAEVVRMRTIEGEAEGPRVEVALTKGAAGARLTRSPCGRYLVAWWKAAPEGRRRSEYGAVLVTRLVLLEAASLGA
jgi:hypothetical protein